MIHFDSTADFHRLRLRITREVKEVITRVSLKLIAVGIAVNSIIVPILVGDKDRPAIWKTAEVLGSSSVLGWVTGVVSAFLFLGVFLPRVRIAAGVLFMLWLSFVAFLHPQAGLTGTLLIAAFIGGLVAFMGVPSEDS